MIKIIHIYIYIFQVYFYHICFLSFHAIYINIWSNEQHILRGCSALSNIYIYIGVCVSVCLCVSVSECVGVCVSVSVSSCITPQYLRYVCPYIPCSAICSSHLVRHESVCRIHTHTHTHADTHTYICICIYIYIYMKTNWFRGGSQRRRCVHGVGCIDTRDMLYEGSRPCT